MSVIVHFPEQVKIGWDYRQLQLIENNKRIQFLKVKHSVTLEIKGGDSVQVKFGLIKSNQIQPKEGERYKIYLSNYLKYDVVVSFLFLIINSIVISSLP